MNKITIGTETSLKFRFITYQRLALLRASLTVSDRSFDLPTLSPETALTITPEMASGIAPGIYAAHLEVFDSTGERQIRQTFPVAVVAQPTVGRLNETIVCPVPIVPRLPVSEPKDTPILIRSKGNLYHLTISDDADGIDLNIEKVNQETP